MFEIRCAGATDIGKKRSTNQDQYLIAHLRKSLVVDQTSITADEQARFVGDDEGHLLLVADGMGGHTGGEVASQLAIDSAVEYVLNTIPWFYRLSQNCDEEFQDELKQALEFCHQRLTKESESNPELRDMGTTLTMCYIIGRNLYVVHVGDSRCYVLREGAIHQLTTDHTMAQMLVDLGELPGEAMDRSPLNHVLWNALGGTTQSSLKPEVIKCKLRNGDRILLCTDGLSRYLTNETLESMLVEDGADVQQRCDDLVAAANLGGGSDNITVVLAAIECDDIVPHRVSEETSNYQSETKPKSLSDTDPHIPAT